MSEKDPESTLLIIYGADCAIPPDERKLLMPDGQEYFYPNDYWPPVPGQYCRPHILRTVGVEVVNIELSGGYLGGFFPGGLETEAKQRQIDKRVKKSYPDHEALPQVRPYADQLPS
ncbi:MAG: hypothetical protein V4702_04115 [Patescibacteria group bacterium]